jgi:hypothetical protein
MRIKQIISAFLMTFVALSAKGQILTDGISGRDRVERLQFIQAISPQGDTCLVMSDSLGRFEIDPYLMDSMRGNVYLKPVVNKPKPKLTLDSPFDSIDVHRKGRVRYLAQNHVIDPKSEDSVFYYDPETTLLKESVVTAKRQSIARDKVTGYLDSLAIMTSGEWYCQHGGEKYLNDYHGYSHHPNSKWPASMVEHYLPKRGEVYVLVKYEPFPDGNWYLTSLIENFVYPGPNYTEEDLLKMNGMWKTQGYHPKREFFQPDELDLASPTPDYRNLLQWQPAVLTDENGIAEIPFAASDVNTEFIGLIEAVDGMGLLGCMTLSFRVIKN